MRLARQTCKYCDREIVEEVPENSGYGACAGLHCGHMRVYGLFDEDCISSTPVVSGDGMAKAGVSQTEYR